MSGTGIDTEGVDGSPDYNRIHVPEGKKPEEYHYTERRAEILAKIQAGTSPWSINQSELAKRYDVSQPMIHKDLKRLKEYLRHNLGEDAEVETNVLMRDIINNIREDAEALRKSGERGQAAKAEKAAASVATKWWDWLFESGEKDRAPDRHEIDAEVRMEKKETKVYAGVDFGKLPGLDAERMVGVSFDEDPTEGPDEEDAEEIEVQDP